MHMCKCTLWWVLTVHNIYVKFPMWNVCSVCTNKRQTIGCIFTFTNICILKGDTSRMPFVLNVHYPFLRKKRKAKYYSLFQLEITQSYYISYYGFFFVSFPTLHMSMYCVRVQHGNTMFHFFSQCDVIIPNL